MATARLYRRGQWQQAEDGSETVVDVYEIIASSETESITSILSASGLPAKGSSHAEKTSAILVDRDLNQDDSVLTVWHLNCRYSTAIQTREDQAYGSQRTKGGVRSSSIEVPAFFDARGYPLVNTAGDLYEGLGRKVRTRTFNVTHNATSIPDYILNLSDTINAAAVTILGTSYPALTCKLTDVNCPDEPVRDNAGDLYYPVTYSIEMNPIGWHILLPNRGPNQLIYQTRTSGSAPWSDVTKAAYDAQGDSNLKRVTKRPIESEEQQNLGGEIWLDKNGQAQTVTTLTSTSVGTGTISAGGTSITMDTGSLPEAPGALIRIAGAGLKGRYHETNLVTVASGGGSGTISRAALEAASAQAVYVSGVIVNEFLLEDVADWSSLPLPNNQP
jgi:hypothetical protein